MRHPGFFVPSMRVSLSQPTLHVVVVGVILAGLCLFAHPLMAAPPAPVPALSGPEAARKALADGLAHKQAGRFLEACAAFRAAAAASPLWSLARYEHAQCLRLLGDRTNTTPADGVDALSEILEAEKDLQRPALYIEKGRLLEDRGQHADALRAYEQALVMMPAEIRAWEGAARTAAIAAPDRESAFIEGWLARNSHDVAAWVRLGRIHEAARRLGEAERAFTEAAQRSVDRKRGAALLGLFAQRSGSRTAADKARRLREEAR